MATRTTAPTEALLLESRHSGEKLSLRRVRRGSEVWLEIKGSLPAGRPGPPLHRHHVETEEGLVKAGTLAFVVDGVKGTAGVGESGTFPRGSAHTCGTVVRTPSSSRATPDRSPTWTGTFKPCSR